MTLSSPLPCGVMSYYCFFGNEAKKTPRQNYNNAMPRAARLAHLNFVGAEGIYIKHVFLNKKLLMCKSLSSHWCCAHSMDSILPLTTEDQVRLSTNWTVQETQNCTIETETNTRRCRRCLASVLNREAFLNKATARERERESVS
jgi:hypothetical protein